MSSYFASDTVDITINCKDVLTDIKTKTLEEELEYRKELKQQDQKEYDRLERYRDNESTISVKLDDYGLLIAEDLTPDYFADHDLIEFLETHRNYAVFYKGTVGTSDADSVYTYLTDLPKWKLKEFMCDTLGLNHFATTEDILNELKIKLS